MTQPNDFEIFIDNLQFKLHTDQVFIEQIKQDYQTQSWEYLYTRLIHDYPIQAKDVIVQACDQKDTTLLMKYLPKYLVKEENTYIIKLPLKDTIELRAALEPYITKRINTTEEKNDRIVLHVQE